MPWKVKLFSEAQKDFAQLDGSVRKTVLKQLVKLDTDPFYGDVLGNMAGFDLTGYYKLYADNKRIRIVYRKSLPLTLRLSPLISARTWKFTKLP